MRRRQPGVRTVVVLLPLLFVGAVVRGYSYASALQMLVRDLFFMQPWFWSAANVALCLAAAILLLGGGDRVRNAALPHAAMVWSGLLLLLPYLLVCLDHDARFTYWIRVSTIFGGLGLAGVMLGALRTRLGADGAGSK